MEIKLMDRITGLMKILSPDYQTTSPMRPTNKFFSINWVILKRFCYGAELLSTK